MVVVFIKIITRKKRSISCRTVENKPTHILAKCFTLLTLLPWLSCTAFFINNMQYFICTGYWSRRAGVKEVMFLGVCWWMKKEASGWLSLIGVSVFEFCSEFWYFWLLHERHPACKTCCNFRPNAFFWNKQTKKIKEATGKPRFTWEVAIERCVYILQRLSTSNYFMWIFSTANRYSAFLGNVKRLVFNRALIAHCKVYK